MGLGLLAVASGVTLTCLWQAAERNYRRTQDYLVLAISSLEQEQREASEHLLTVPGSTDYRIHRLEEAIELLSYLARENPENRFVQRRLAVAYYLFSQIPKFEGRADQIVTALESALQLFTQLAAADLADHSLRFDMFHSHLGLGVAQSRAGEIEAAHQHFRTALAMIDILASEHPEEPKYLDALACLQQVVAGMLCNPESPADLEFSRTLANEAITLATHLADAYPAIPIICGMRSRAGGSWHPTPATVTATRRRCRPPCTA